MKTFIRSIAIAALSVFALAGASAPSFAEIVLSSNMNAADEGSAFFVTNTQWVAAPFRTTSELTWLTDVNLDIFDAGDYAGGNLSVEIWTTLTNQGPNAFVQSILNSSFSSRPVSIAGLSVMLQPNTDYAVVARGNVFNENPESEYDGLLWSVVSVTTHIGDGFVSGLWAGQDPDSMTRYDNKTFKMSILATNSAPDNSVPEIDPSTGGSALSLVAGVLAMIEQRRRRVTLVL